MGVDVVFPRYESYKPARSPWIREVPSHWKLLPGIAVLKENKDRNIGMIEETVLSLSYGKVIIKSPEKLTGLVPESFETYQVINPNDIIIRPTDLQNDHTSLRTGLAKNRGIITSAYICLRPNSSHNPTFIHYLLHAYDLLKVYYGMGSGLRQNLGYRDFKRLELYIPSSKEQDRIANFLDQKTTEIDAAIIKKQRLIELLKEQKAILINQAVTKGLNDVPMRDSGVEWIGEVPGHWEVKRLKFVVKKIFDCKNRTPEYFEKGNFFVIRTSNVRDGKLNISEKNTLYTDRKNFIEWTKKGQPKPGELVFTREAPAGEVAMVPKSIEMCLGQRTMGIKPDKNQVGGEYLLYFLQSQVLRKYVELKSAGSTVSHLRVGQVFDIPIVFPKSLDEQKNIVTKCRDTISEIDHAIGFVEKDIDVIKEFRTTLISEAVTGKIKL